MRRKDRELGLDRNITRRDFVHDAGALALALGAGASRSGASQSRSAGERRYLAGRKPIGRIAIANTDSGAMPLLKVAIDQAWRAVNELPA